MVADLKEAPKESDGFGLDEPGVSVVVPVYNTAAYLPKCIESITAQTLNDIEIIFIDDGSTDNSWEVLKSYAAADKRIRLFSQDNSFAGVARNKGLEKARGKYVLFFDSDDYMSQDALQLMYSQCEEYDADICVCAGERYYEQLDVTVSTPGYLEKKRIPSSGPFNRISNAEHIFSFTTIMSWNKLFRREFLQANNLLFGSTRNGEDVVICALALWKASCITVVKRPVVFYRIDRSDSLVGTLSESAVDPLRAWLDVWRMIGGEMGQSKRSFDCKVLGVIRHTFRNVSTFSAFKECFEFLRNGVLDEMDLRPREEGYYYTPWYNSFIAHLKEDSLEDFAVYVLYSTSRDLELEAARRLDSQRKAKQRLEKLQKTEKKLAATEKDCSEIKRKFAKVEPVYNVGMKVLKVLRRIKKRLSVGNA